MSYLYLILFGLVICSTVAAEYLLEPAEVQILSGESKREEGRRELTIVVGKSKTVVRITCGDDEDCRKKIVQAVHKVMKPAFKFPRYG
uniref:U39-Sparatoxin-Hju1h_1 n=1 Tax=Heteropoda jugulans TaxID=1358901 RepID=A0A4Q8K9Q6_9ARAC